VSGFTLPLLATSFSVAQGGSGSGATNAARTAFSRNGTTCTVN
jgi:hypothetical protein